ncbi:hypothetical protein J4032_13960 [Streptomyces formicae]|uniref:Uncharacterized protein n=1 Tax=Streptomyces formicae TaxID=1616117 RepID=A0ABY3WIT8_9ACTN|nr:hypothetical protein [Streptomyces formicae]UNM12493.1 hypothetical protein J4032_13960 [Streptomyces formicae]
MSDLHGGLGATRRSCVARAPEKVRTGITLSGTRGLPYGLCETKAGGTA